MVGRLLSFWDGIFSGAMLNFQGVVVRNLNCLVAVALVQGTKIDGYHQLKHPENHFEHRSSSPKRKEAGSFFQASIFRGKLAVSFQGRLYIYYIYIYTPRMQLTSIFEPVNPPKQGPFASIKAAGSFGF